MQDGDSVIIAITIQRHEGEVNVGMSETVNVCVCICLGWFLGKASPSPIIELLVLCTQMDGLSLVRLMQVIPNWNLSD